MLIYSNISIYIYIYIYHIISGYVTFRGSVDFLIENRNIHECIYGDTNDNIRDIQQRRKGMFSKITHIDICENIYTYYVINIYIDREREREKVSIHHLEIVTYFL